VGREAGDRAHDDSGYGMLWVHDKALEEIGAKPRIVLRTTLWVRTWQLARSVAICPWSDNVSCVSDDLPSLPLGVSPGITLASGDDWNSRSIFCPLNFHRPSPE
jgi:hypothetical protein